MLFNRRGTQPASGPCSTTSLVHQESFAAALASQGTLTLLQD